MIKTVFVHHVPQDVPTVLRIPLVLHVSSPLPIITTDLAVVLLDSSSPLHPLDIVKNVLTILLLVPASLKHLPAKRTLLW